MLLVKAYDKLVEIQLRYGAEIEVEGVVVGHSGHPWPRHHDRLRGGSSTDMKP